MSSIPWRARLSGPPWSFVHSRVGSSTGLRPAMPRANPMACHSALLRPFSTLMAVLSGRFYEAAPESSD